MIIYFTVINNINEFSFTVFKVNLNKKIFFKILIYLKFYRKYYNKEDYESSLTKYVNNTKFKSATLQLILFIQNYKNWYCYIKLVLSFKSINNFLRH